MKKNHCVVITKTYKKNTIIFRFITDISYLDNISIYNVSINLLFLQFNY